MRHSFAVSVAIVFALAHTAQTRRFSRCELAKELKNNDITDLRNWVCMAESESGLNTSKVGGPNSNKSLDYGIFQINNRYWCKEGQRGGDCNIKCEDLRNDNISDDIECAKKIHKRHGFRAWYGWRNKCDGKTLPDLSRC